MFLLRQEKKYVTTVVYEATNRKQLLTDVARRKGVIEAAGKELEADPWRHDFDGIKYFLAGVRESFAGKERLICRCYLGLRQWYSKNEKDDKLVVDFALDLLRTLEPAKPFVKLSVLLSVLESSRLAPQLAKSPELVAAVHSLADQLPFPRGIRSDRLFTGLCNTFHGCQNKQLLKLHLQLFSPLLARAPGQHTAAGIGWLMQTIAQASEAGVTSKEIRGLIPHETFSWGRAGPMS